MRGDKLRVLLQCTAQGAGHQPSQTVSTRALNRKLPVRASLRLFDRIEL